jgi:hypothetical protein
MGTDLKMTRTMNWETLGLGSAVAFILGFFTFGLLGAVVLTLVVLAIQVILRFS